MKRFEKIVSWFTAFLEKAKRVFSSRRFLIGTGAFTLLFVGVYVNYAVAATIVNSNPAQACGKQFLAYRQTVITQGSPLQPVGIESYTYRFETEIEGEKYDAQAIASNEASDWFSFTYVYYPAGQDYCLSFRLVGDSYSDAMGVARSATESFNVYAQLFKTNGKPFDMQPPPTSRYYFADDLSLVLLDSNFNDPTVRTYIPAEIDLEKAFQETDDHAKGFASNLPNTLSHFGVTDFSKFVKDYINGILRANSLLQWCWAFIVLSVLGSLSTAAFVVSLMLVLAEKKKRVFAQREDAQEIKDVAETPTPIEAPENQNRNGKVEAFLQRHHIRPVLGEWFFRGLGLALVGIGTLLLYIFLKIEVRSSSSIYTETEVWLQPVVSAGEFLLVIALINIISETHRRLKVSAFLWFILGLGYYFVMGAVYTTMDLTLPALPGGHHITDLYASSSANNFVGIGIFALIGFFLYADPPKWFINRKTFRALSLIPVGIALLSVTVAILDHLNVYMPSFWIRNLLFTRDFELVIIGIAYEYIIFAFRCFLRKRYGEENTDAQMARPIIQFNKNIGLCLLIVVFTVVYYCSPEAFHASLGIYRHTFVFLLIPFLLFSKPAGLHHKARNDVIYYVLYVIAMYAPSILAGEIANLM